MIRRDYILRMVQELGEALRRVRKRVEAGELAEAGGELDDAFRMLMDTGAEAAAKLSETELLAKLTLEGPTHFVKEKTLILVALLQEAGMIQAEAGRDEEAQARWIKALNLLLTLRMQDTEFEFPEFVPKIDFLRDELCDATLPLQTLAALWRHYEHIGAYGRAEDALAALLEREPDNEELIVEARKFYKRLLRESDAVLVEGNLPRAEVTEALARLAPQG
jgi:tetratricopeptide (TPR) repeat protein